MNSLFILIPIALVFVAIAIRAFIWAVNNRQYDDLDAAANSILFDDDAPVTVAPELREESARDGEQRQRADAGGTQSRVGNE